MSARGERRGCRDKSRNSDDDRDLLASLPTSDGRLTGRFDNMGDTDDDAERGCLDIRKLFSRKVCTGLDIAGGCE